MGPQTEGGRVTEGCGPTAVELLYTGFVTGGATDGPPWVHHWLCLPQLIAPDMMPVALPSDQNRLRDGGVPKSNLKLRVKIYHGKYVPVTTVNGKVFFLN